MVSVSVSAPPGGKGPGAARTSVTAWSMEAAMPRRIFRYTCEIKCVYVCGCVFVCVTLSDEYNSIGVGRDGGIMNDLELGLYS